jgi:hypothetical protein
MMRDANSYHSDDPAHRWSALLEGLFGLRREMVIKALRNSVASGYPANADGVRILVAYAKGQISARQYVVQTLESLGFVPQVYTPPPARQPESWREPVRPRDPWSDERYAPRPPQAAPALLDFGESRIAREPQRFDSNTITHSRQTTREQAVQAYVTGQIPVEEFIRLSGGLGG